MLGNNKLKIFVLIIVCFFYITTFSQKSKQVENSYILLDSLIGIENTAISNGSVYVEKFKTERNKNTHKFFLKNEYQLGNIVYDNQKYYNILMKLDLYKNQIIVKLKNKSNLSSIKLIKEKVKNFSINSDYFVNSRFFKNSNLESEYNFYQVLFQSKYISLLKLNKKQSIEYIKDQNIFYKFKDKVFYNLLYKDNLFEVKSKRDIMSIFPTHKSDIYLFYKKNKQLYRKNKNNFYTELTKLIHNLHIKKLVN